MNGISPEQEAGSSAAERRSQISVSKRPTESTSLSNTETIADEQLVAAISASEPRMAALAISNDALRDSLRPAVPPSLRGWIYKTLVNPWWRYLEYGYTEAVCWLWARAPWQRWSISAGLGAVLGLAIVIAVAPRFRPDLEREAAASGETLVATAELDRASTMVIAPLRKEPPAAAAAVVKDVEPSLAASAVAIPAPDAPSAVEISEPEVDEPAAAPNAKKSKKKKKSGHGRRTKPKSASNLSTLFRSLRHVPPDR